MVTATRPMAWSDSYPVPTKSTSRSSHDGWKSANPTADSTRQRGRTDSAAVNREERDSPPVIPRIERVPGPKGFQARDDEMAELTHQTMKRLGTCRPSKLFSCADSCVQEHLSLS